MYYKIVKDDRKTDVTSYRVYEKGHLAAEFTYKIRDYHRKKEHVATEESPFYEGSHFWIDSILLFSPFEHYDVMDAILHFIQYKCTVSGYSQMYVRLNARNLFYIELYKRYGFYVIANEGKTNARGVYDHSYVLKYSIPETIDDMYQHYIRVHYSDQT